MDSSLITALNVTVAGMTIVFVIMAFIFASMHLLTRLARSSRQEVVPSGAGEPGPAPVAESAGASSTRLQAAAVAVLLARQESSDGSEGEIPAATPWGDYHRRRQLRPSGRGRIA